MLKKPITIDSWQNGIGSSPHSGFESIFNADLFNVDGVIKPNFELFLSSDAPVTGLTFTANSSTNVITVIGGTFERTIGGGSHLPDGRIIQVSTVGTLPSGLSASTNYFIVNSSTGQSFQLSTTLGGSAVSLGSSGSGTLNIFSVDPAEINYFAYNKDSGIVYGQDVNAIIWEYTGGVWEMMTQPSFTNSGSTAGMGNGLIVWKNYLLAFRQNYIDCYGPLSGSPSWTVGDLGLIGSQGTGYTPIIYHQPFISTNNVLYWSDILVANSSGANYINPYVGSLQESPTSPPFAPGTSASYILETQALPLPTSEFITCFGQLGSNLMIGTILNNIYPWDRVSTNYQLPIWAAENYIHSMVNINSVLYFSAGNKGNIYKTYGTYAVNVVDFSDYLSGFPQYTVFETELVKYQSRLMFAISQANPNSLGSAIATADQISGVYSLNLGAGETSAIGANTAVGYSMDFQSSGGLGVTIPDIIVVSDWGNTYGVDNDREFNVFVSWKTIGASTNGIDMVQNGQLSVGPYRATGNLCQAASQIYQIGSANEPQTPERFLLNLTKPLASGESIKIQFRNNDTVGGTWSTGTTFTGTSTPSAPTISTTSGEALGGGIGLRDNVNLENCIWLQALITLNAASGAAYACPELRNVEIY